MLTKQRLYHEIISFIRIVVYLFLLFGVFALHEAVVSAKDGIEYHFYGFAIANALVLGKVILIAEDFRFAEWFREQRPIYAILAKSVAFRHGPIPVVTAHKNAEGHSRREPPGAETRIPPADKAL